MDLLVHYPDFSLLKIKRCFDEGLSRWANVSFYQTVQNCYMVITTKNISNNTKIRIQKTTLLALQMRFNFQASW